MRGKQLEAEVSGVKFIFSMSSGKFCQSRSNILQVKNTEILKAAKSNTKHFVHHANITADHGSNQCSLLRSSHVPWCRESHIVL